MEMYIFGAVSATIAALITSWINKLVLKKSVINAMIPGETIACMNATVILDKNGNVTAWIDNGELYKKFKK